MVVSGSVTTYDTPAVKTEIADSTADRLGVAASDVTVSILPGSVIIRLEIATTSVASTATMSALTTTYSGTSGAQSLLAGVTSVALTVVSAQSPTLADTPVADVNEDNAMSIPMVAGAAAGVVLLVIVLVCCCRKKPQKEQEAPKRTPTSSVAV